MIFTTCNFVGTKNFCDLSFEIFVVNFCTQINRIATIIGQKLTTNNSALTSYASYAHEIYVGNLCQITVTVQYERHRFFYSPCKTNYNVDMADTFQTKLKRSQNFAHSLNCTEWEFAFKSDPH